MRQKTKLKLRFYLSLAVLILLTILTGAFFLYLARLAWQVRYGLISVKYEIFMAMAAILFMMCITDIVLFFRLVIKRVY